jgi:hypothetical protein
MNTGWQNTANVYYLANLRLIQTYHAVPMLFPCRSPATPCRVNSHMSYRAPAILRQCCVLRESPRANRKYPNCKSYSLTECYASDNNLRGTPRGSRKKPNAGRSSTCRLWTANANTHMLCSWRAVPWPWVVASRTTWSWHGTGAAWHVWIKHGRTV